MTRKNQAKQLSVKDNKKSLQHNRRHNCCFLRETTRLTAEFSKQNKNKQANKRTSSQTKSVSYGMVSLIKP